MKCISTMIILISGLAWVQGACAQDPASEAGLQAQQLCARLSEVKELPIKREPVGDPVYNQLKSLGNAAFPCLVREITNVKPTQDPRKAPHYGSVKIGDVAFWILVDLAQLPYDEMFPPDVRKRFPTEGVYAYFDWVNKLRNRRCLQRNVSSYLERRNRRAGGAGGPPKP